MIHYSNTTAAVPYIWSSTITDTVDMHFFGYLFYYKYPSYRRNKYLSAIIHKGPEGQIEETVATIKNQMTGFRYISTALLTTDLREPKAVGDGKLGEAIPDEARAAVKCVKSDITPLPELLLEYLIVSTTD